MDEDFVAWLVLIPGVGRRRAEQLAKKFRSIEKLRAASLDDIRSIEGFGDVLARRVKAFVKKAAVHAKGGEKARETALYLCPGCGALLGRDAKKCPFCDTAVEGEQGPPGAESQGPSFAPTPLRATPGEPQTLNLCPQCGAFVGKEVSACPSCGTPLEDEEEVAAPSEVATTPAAPVPAEAKGLYLCPTCGSFVGADAATCLKCGASLEGEEEAPPAEPRRVEGLPPRTLPDEPSLFICTNCGAFLRSEETTCSLCGVGFETGEVAEQALAPPAEKAGALSICPSCGALVPRAAAKCGICGRPLPHAVPEKPSPPAPEETGITKDFAKRWRRVSEEEALSPEAHLLRKLERYDDILGADPSLERAWLKKAGVLVQLGRIADAVACYEKLADLEPTKAKEYGLEVLNLLRAQGDLSRLPRRWSAIAATEPAREPVPPKAPKARPPAEVSPEPREDVAKVTQALDFYERLLQVDPSLLVGWQTKAELLQKLGRREEADAALRRAESLARTRAVTPGLRTTAPRVSPREGGRVNGMGRVNGRINGIGRINGSGRVNGRGRVNGAGATGLTNGMNSGIGPGEGRVNGLVNGTGLTNGRRGRWTPPRPHTPGSWMRSVAGIAAIALLLLFIPILATLLSTSPTARGGITIDGRFGDWSAVPEYTDNATDQTANLDVNLVGYRLHAADGVLLMYARVAGVLFDGAGGGADSVYAFIDEDGDPATGFSIGVLGAERAVELYGWDGVLAGGSEWVYASARAGPASDDWRSFDRAGSVVAASGSSQLEAQIDVASTFAPDRARVLFHTLDGAGRGDAADGVVGTRTGALTVTERTIAGDVVSGTLVPFLQIEARPLGASVSISSMTIEANGTYPAAGVTGRLYLDEDRDGIVDPADPLLGIHGFAPTATFTLNRLLQGPESYLLSADFAALASNASVGFRLVAVTPTVGSAIPVTLSDAGLTMAYVDGPPGTVSIDGAFGDWSRYALHLDGDDDVQTVSYNEAVNENLDLRAYEAAVDGNVSVYLRVDGRLFGGVDIPNFRGRDATSRALSDSDGDSVPDEVETAIAPGLAVDFNNDNVSDADQYEDVDQDGLLDYNKCPAQDCSLYVDFTLETVIPAWYPPAYAGATVRRYIGPVSVPPQRGVDTALVYVDRDNRTDTGLLAYADGVPYGLDYAYQAVGRGGIVLQSGLFAFNASRTIPWERVADAPTAIDALQLEASLDPSLLNLTANYTFLFFTSDWQHSFDSASTGTAIRRAPGPWTRSINGDNVVINEVSATSKAEWVELANPTPNPISLSGWTLQRQKGGNWVTIFTFTQTIGAWGSGGEYLSVDPTKGSLPNGGAAIRLVASNGTVVDVTSYPGNIANGQTWSRFKHATTGKPVDTNNDANDFYVSTSPTKTAPNDRHRPRITVAKIRNKATAAPGELITYTVYYNNTDTGRANTVWINDTLPSDVAFVSASVPFISTNGKSYLWVFTNVNPVTLNSFTITVRVNATAPNGGVLRNTVGLNYTDQLGRKQTASVATANTTVVRPVIVVEKIVDKATALPGDTLTYTVFYNNTGSAVANHVWVNDTLPMGVAFLSGSPPPGQIDNQTLRWHFTSVAPGPHSLTILVTVSASPPQVLVNWAFLNYTAQNDYLLQPSQDNAVTSIPEFPAFLAPLAVPLLISGLRRLRPKRRVAADSVPGTGGR